jgi:hypothetical protein
MEMFETSGNFKLGYFERKQSMAAWKIVGETSLKIETCFLTIP